MRSVWEGNDKNLLDQMIPFYCGKPKVIIDVTCNTRKMWKGSTWPTIFIDIDPSVKPDFVGDFTNLKNIARDESVDLVIFDPPHWPTTSKGNAEWNKKYGILDRGGSRAVLDFFNPFFQEASRYLKPKGVVFAKMTDLVNGRKYIWQHIHLISSGSSYGFTPCDLIVKTRKNAMISGRWKKSHHARKFHSYWIVFRKGKGCQ